MTFQDDIRKAWYKSKTMLFNLFLLLSGGAAFFAPVVEELESTGMDPQTVAVLRVAVMLVGAIGAALRMSTAGGVTLK